jgi:hypothetical protein
MEGFGHKKPDGATVLLRCSKGKEPYRTGIDPLDSLDSLDSLDFLDSLDSLDTDPNTDSDNDQTHRKPLPKGDVGDT